MSPFAADTSSTSRLEYFFNAPKEVPKYVVVFILLADGFLIANIKDRGWCVPSGRIEDGETPIEAAVREVEEETGYAVTDLVSVGSFRTVTTKGNAWAEAFFTTQAQEIGPPTGDDSLGRRAASLGELPDVYYRWGPFYEAVFGHMLALRD